MPTYDYRCDQCGDEFEVWQSIKDDALTECPRCGGSIRKVMSPAGIVLKGSGFYKTDNRRGNGGGDAASKSDGDKTSDGDKKSDGDKTSHGDKKSDGDKKSESKSEKKAEKRADSKTGSGKKD